MASLSNQPTVAPFATSDTKATSDYRGPFGAVYYDPANPQNAYMLVDCQAAFVVGEVVVIDGSGLASRITSTSVGLVGVIVATVSGSDTAAYAQIEGDNASAILTSGVTTAAFLIAPATTDGGYLDILTTTEANTVYNARCVAAPSTATTPFTSDTQASALVGVGTLRMNRGGAFVYGIVSNHGTVS